MKLKTIFKSKTDRFPIAKPATDNAISKTFLPTIISNIKPVSPFEKLPHRPPVKNFTISVALSPSLFLNTKLIIIIMANKEKNIIKEPYVIEFAAP